MTGRSLAWRRTKDSAVKTLAVAAAFVGLFFLGWILWEVVARGFGALDWAFFTELPRPPGQTGGGLANAIVGTIIITGLAALMGVPVGMLAGVYLAEFGRESRFAPAVRFLANVLMGIPSIVVGVFVYALLVMQHRMWFLSWGGHFSAYAGAVALAIIMLPLVARTTEDMLNLVPNVLRESALALGVPRWRATLGVVFRSAKSGLLTGVLLGIARVSGETAPLLFTALNSPYWMRGISDPTANLTVTIFSYAMSPYSDWKQQAWGASLVITAGVLLMTVAARLILRKRIQWS
jgi:phosphate transport system permease protein